MNLLFALLAVGLLALGVYWTVENLQHSRNLNRIPHRVLVNGIRGKSSITRLVRAALAADPRQSVAGKTTGTAARYLHPDGREEPVARRRGVANVIEQVAIVARAARQQATTLVIECMAVLPELQKLNQDRLIRSTVGVISNVREDHLEEMGGPDRSLDQVARSLALSMPAGGLCVTAEKQRWHILKAEADRRGCRLVYADPGSVTREEMAPFRWVTYPENVAIALTVASLFGVPRGVALRAMYAAPPDPGTLTVEQMTYHGKPFAAVNLFAANDPQSTAMGYDMLRQQQKITGRVNVVVGCRPDRAERNLQMVQLLPQLDTARVFLVGSPTRDAASQVPAGIETVDLGDVDGRAALAAVAARIGDGDTLLMVGNIHGRGEELLHALASHTAGPTDEELQALLAETVELPVYARQT